MMIKIALRMLDAGVKLQPYLNFYRGKVIESSSSSSSCYVNFQMKI